MVCEGGAKAKQPDAVATGRRAFAFAFALAPSFASMATFASSITSLASSSFLTIEACFTPVLVLDWESNMSRAGSGFAGCGTLQFLAWIRVWRHPKTHAPP